MTYNASHACCHTEKMSYTTTVAAISDALRSQHLQGLDTEHPDCETIVREIVAAQARMPDYLRLPMRVLTWLFDIAGLFRGGQRFSNQDLSRRVALIDAWRHSSIGLCRNFVRFYESLFLLVALQEDIR